MSRSSALTPQGSAFFMSAGTQTHHSVKPSTTLNEKFDVQSGVSSTVNELPAMKYLAIGVGGFETSCVNDEPVFDGKYRSSNKAFLYEHVPFLVRPINNDISPVEREKYFMRTIITIDGADHIAYYLMKQAPNLITNVVEKWTKVENAYYTKETITPDSNWLNPVPPTKEEVTAAVNDYHVNSSLLPILLTETDIENIALGLQLLYGDAGKPFISELGLCSGIEREVTTEGITYTEVIESQLIYSLNTSIPSRLGSPALDTDAIIQTVSPMYVGG